RPPIPCRPASVGRGAHARSPSPVGHWWPDLAPTARGESPRTHGFFLREYEWLDDEAVVVADGAAVAAAVTTTVTTTVAITSSLRAPSRTSSPVVSSRWRPTPVPPCG